MKEKKKENLILGAIICLIGYFCIAVMGACAKAAGAHVPVIEVLFFQNIVCFILNLPQSIKGRIKGLKTKKIGMHFIRDLMGFLSFLTLFWSFKLIPLVDGLLLQNTAPLWIPITAFIWMKIKVPKYLWWGMIIGFFGVILILKPTQDLINIGAFLGLFSGVTLSVSLLAIRKLALTEPTYRILFYYFLFNFIITLPFAIWSWTTPNFTTFWLLISVGIFSYLAQLLITYSFFHGEASILGPISYSAIVFAGLLGWWIWDHIPDWMSFIGMALVIFGGSLSIILEKRLEKRYEQR